MPPAPIPSNESARDRELQRFCLQGEADPDASSFAEVAAALTGCPTAMVSIVQDDRQWFMGSVGIDIHETPRDHAFCAFAIQGKEPMIVTDARTDPRFRDNPLVTGEFGLRFYAGFPLITSAGVAVGSLCVLDHKPRRLDDSVVAAMSHLRDLAVRFIRSRGEAIVHRTESESKSRFLANIGHEIRTPLTAVLGFAEVICERTGEPGYNPAETAITIRRQGRHLLDLMNDMLEISKLDAGRVEPEILEFSPSEVVAECLELFEWEARRKQISLGLCIDDGVPVALSGDPTRIRQALLNLISNAVKFTEQGGITVRVWYEPGDRAAGTLRATVTDTGEGIAPEALQRIRSFRAFTQADRSTTREHGGTGLGLSIVHSIVRLFGGKLTIDSQPGVGTTAGISILAPIAESPGRSIETPRGTPRGTRDLFHLRGAAVLVAEDGEDNQSLIRHHLERAGAHVTIVEDGQELVDAVEAGLRSGSLPDLIIADLHMPRLDGIGAVREIRALGVGIPIGALSADNGDGVGRACRDAGFDLLMAKPFTRDSLLKGCETMLNAERRAA